MLARSRLVGTGMWALGMAVAGVATTHAAVIRVPEDHSTIQAAIDAAQDGDVVTVAKGTYQESINFHNKVITVTSSGGPKKTIIDGAGRDAVVQLRRGEGLGSSVLDGFAITNGLSWGIACGDSDVVISNCIIRDNNSGISVSEGIGNPLIQNCLISSNNTRGWGGGIACWGGATIRRCVISDNSAEAGGGIACGVDSNLQISNCIISNNVASVGAGIHCRSYSDLQIHNSTITGNEAFLEGGGVAVTQNSVVSISNSIFWSNEAGQSGAEILLKISSGLTVSYCDVAGGEAGAFVDDDSELIWQEGNIDAHPLFRRGLHLRFRSPCRDAGDPDFVPESGEMDIDGDPRVIEDRVDMGADEVVPRGLATPDISAS